MFVLWRSCAAKQQKRPISVWRTTFFFVIQSLFFFFLRPRSGRWAAGATLVCAQGETPPLPVCRLPTPPPPMALPSEPPAGPQVMQINLRRRVSSGLDKVLHGALKVRGGERAAAGRGRRGEMCSFFDWGRGRGAVANASPRHSRTRRPVRPRVRVNALSAGVMDWGNEAGESFLVTAPSRRTKKHPLLSKPPSTRHRDSQNPFLTPHRSATSGQSWKPSPLPPPAAPATRRHPPAPKRAQTAAPPPPAACCWAPAPRTRVPPPTRFRRPNTMSLRFCRCFCFPCSLVLLTSTSCPRPPSPGGPP